MTEYTKDFSVHDTRYCDSESKLLQKNVCQCYPKNIKKFVYFFLKVCGRIVMSMSVCVGVCVCVLCVCPRAYLPKPHARSLPHVLCMLPIAVARFYSGVVTQSQGKGQFWGCSSPLTMHCTA